MNTLVIVLIILALGVAAYALFLFGRSRSNRRAAGSEPGAASDSGGGRTSALALAGSGIPEGKEELYEWGMHPAGDGTPVMYTLTTCRHCVHLKDFLDKHGIAHHLVFVDDFTGPARFAMMGVLRGHNPRGSFPTLILPGGKTLVGFREQDVRAAFGLPLAS